MGSAARRTMVRARSGSAWSSAFMLCRFSFQAFGDELAHVFHLERPLGLLHLTAEVYHGEAERTAGADHVHLRLEDLLHADQVDPLLGLHFHPHVAAAATAAEAARTAAGELDHSEPRHRARDATGRLRDAVVAAEIAGIVERERRVERFRRLDPPRADQLVDHLRVMEDLVGPAELRELVPDRVEAVRAVGDHLPEAVPVDRGDVLLLEGLIEVLLAEPTGDLAVAPLLLHDAEGPARRLQDLRHRPADRLVAPVVRRRAAHPVE